MQVRRFLALLICAVSVPAAYTGDIDVSASPISGGGGPFAAEVSLETQPTSGAPASTVMAWNSFASNVAAAHLLPGPQAYALAIVHIAVHDALNSIEPR